MLFSPFSINAQNISRNCKWVQKHIVVQKYNWRTEQLEPVDDYELVYECTPSLVETSRERPTSKTDNQQKTDKSSTSRISVPADNPLLGTWKCEEYHEAVKDKYFPIERYLIRSITLIYSQDGVVESIFVERLWEKGRAKGNWKYTPKNDSSGVVEEYQGDDLGERGSIKWISKNQIEYTVTFNKDENVVGKKFIFTRQ